MLSSIADGEAIRFANEQAAKLRHGMNEILAREQVAWKVYGEHSDWKLFYGADAPPRDGADQSVDGIDWQRLDAKHAEQSRALRQALILQGVDFNGGRALVGTCHTDDVIAETLAGFRGRRARDEGRRIRVRRRPRRPVVVALLQGALLLASVATPPRSTTAEPRRTHGETCTKPSASATRAP